MKQVPNASPKLIIRNKFSKLVEGMLVTLTAPDCYHTTVNNSTSDVPKMGEVRFASLEQQNNETHLS